VLLALGLPFVLAGAWYYRLGATGIAAPGEGHGHHAVGPAGVRVAAVATALLVMLATAIGVRFFNMQKGHGHEAPEELQVSAAAPVLPAAPAATSVFTPPAHSIAVLPFVNMSGDSKEDYFSDGLSEELLNSLARITQLQVAARTSSFSFKGKEMDIGDMARKLNVSAVLEGSVRKDGTRVRITAQLINAVTGFHLWSQTYDRELRDILQLQTEIATAVTTALQATLLGNSSTVIQLGGTSNALAFDKYLRAGKLAEAPQTREALLERLGLYAEAIRIDPSFANAYVEKSGLLTTLAQTYANGAEVRERFAEARAAAQKAIELAPDLGEAHSALGTVLDDGYGDYPGAASEYERAVALAPGSAEVLRSSAIYLSSMGRFEAAAANAERAVQLDPLNGRSHKILGRTRQDSRRYSESIDAFGRALSLNPNQSQVASLRGYSYLAIGEFEAARKSCSTPPLDWLSRTCLAMAYQKLGRQPDAEAAFAALKASDGDDAAYQYAEIYAQWGDIPKALDWLEAAFQKRDTGLINLRIDNFLDPLRAEPRFKEIERKLKFPT
jgi:TolB-like protein/Flp pilus assembly protein TadD